MSVDVLQAKIHKPKSPVMAGLGPSPALISPSLVEGEGVGDTGVTLAGDCVMVFEGKLEY